MTISAVSVVSATEDQVSAELEAETVVLGLRQGVYYGLDQVAARIWSLVQTPTRVSDIRDAIVAEFDVDAETCLADMLEFLDSLEVEGLIRILHDSSERI